MKDNKNTKENKGNKGNTPIEREREREREREEKGRNRFLLAHNGSQGGNGLLHLIHITSRELEHRGD